MNSGSVSSIWPAARNLIWREVRINVLVSVGSALFFSTAFAEPFVTNLIYSFCVSIVIQTLIEGGRYGMAYGLRKRQPQSFGAERIWPGWGLMGPWVIASALGGYVAGEALGNLITGTNRTGLVELLHHPRTLMLVLAGTLVIALGITFFFQARGEMANIEARAQAAMRAATENRLKLLESQLEPHMLFNTLANLRVLITLDPLRAQGMLDRLIGFLRATLEASRAEAGSHTLGEEFARLADYLELMEVRMGARLHAQLDMPADLAGLPVPPLLLQPLVENAIKHGLKPKIEGGRIHVAARRDGAWLVLSVRDTGVGLQTPVGAAASPNDSTQFGMQQIRERLSTLYGKAATIELAAADDQEGGMLAVVRLPIS